MAVPRVRYDRSTICARLRETAEAWVPALFPNGKRQGDDWRLANIQGDPPRKSGSCVITLTGDHAGNWTEFDGGAGGGPLSTLGHGTGLSGRTLMEHAVAIVGGSAGAKPPRMPRVAREASRDVTRYIASILQQAMPIAATPAERFLQQRGLAVRADADLRFHPSLLHRESRRAYPALIGVVRDQAGELMAVHHTYLQADSDQLDRIGKAPVAEPRMMLGKTGGGAVRLAAIGNEGMIGLSEGIESGLAVTTACPTLPVWATLSARGLELVQLPPEAQRVVILADHDPSGAGMRAAEAAAGRLRAEGFWVVIALPPREGDDFNDLLQRDGPQAVKAVVQAALDGVQASGEAVAAPTGRHLPSGFVGQARPLPELRADNGDLAGAVDRAWTVLLGSNSPPWLFRCGGLPSWITPDDDGRLASAALTEDRLRHMLAKLATWQRANKSGELVPAPPPSSLVKSLLATPDPRLPILAGIVATPVFGHDGTLLTEPGYHPSARLLYHPTPGCRVPPIPERPTAEQVAAARSLILDDLLGDFPFTSPAERAHAVALLLLGFVRPMVEGPTPLHLIEKPTPGTGATLMVDAIATILTGAGASVMTEGRDDEEWRKRLTAKLRQIPTVVLIDNLRHDLDSSAVAAALTATFWEDRILGISEMVRLPVRCTWIATGNNPQFSNEMTRRLVRIRLDAQVDQPWCRAAFRHPDLMGWVRGGRGRLVAACLVLCQAWIAAGRPRGQRKIGSYESWSESMGGILKTAGIEGFLGNLDEMLASSDSEGTTWRNFIAAWWDKHRSLEVGSLDLYGVAIGVEPPLPLGKGNDRSQRIKLGKALARIRDRIFRINEQVVQVKAAGTYQGAGRWCLESVQDRSAAEAPHHRSTPAGPVNVVNVGECAPPDIHEPKAAEKLGLVASRECRECSPYAYTRAGARAHVREGSEKHSPHSQHSPTPANPPASGGECGGESADPHSPTFTSSTIRPAWLDDAP